MLVLRPARRAPARKRAPSAERTPVGLQRAGAIAREWPHAAGRAPIAWSLSLLFAFKAIVALAIVAFPLSAHQPSGVAAGAGAFALAAACASWLLGPRISLRGFELIAAAAVLAASGLVASARTDGGMMVAALAYPWVAIYAAHFFPRRVVNALGVLISVAFAAGLALGGLPHPGIYWFVVSATVWSICLVLGGLSADLRRQIATDQLTGALNRGGFIAAAQRERAVADRTGAALCLAAIDLDDFKQINDWGGHATGDRLLAALASDWRARLRPGDILARHGGDEFVLLLPSTTEPQARDAISRLHSDEQPVNWSVGVTEWHPGEQLSAALARADAELYEAKLAKPAPTQLRAASSLTHLAAARASRGS